MGIYVITCDYLPDNIAHKYSDEYRNASIVNKEEILKVAIDVQPDGIISVSDLGIVSAAYAAEILGLPTSPLQSIEILQNKGLFRHFLKEHNFNIPFFKVFDSIDAAERDVRNFSCPVVIKPVDSSGSRGVTKLDDVTDLREAAQLALSHSQCKQFIVEEFLEPKFYASDSDCFSVNGKLSFVSFSRQYFDNSTLNPFVPCGYIWPSDLSIAAQQELKNELQRLIELLHMGTTIYNIECRLGKNGTPYLMEVAPRAGGNRIAEILQKACGQDLLTSWIKGALGLRIDKMGIPVYDGYWAEIIMHSDEKGVFKNIELDHDIAPYIRDVTMWISPGAMVFPFRSLKEAIGSVTLHFSSLEEAENVLAKMNQLARVIVQTV